MPRIAFLGLGAMGQRMALRLVDAGHDVVVWNRTASAVCEPHLAERLRESPSAATDGADFVISMVTDDVASREVWERPPLGALATLRRDAVAIECSTLTPSRIMQLREQVASRGAQLLDAPVVGSRPQAESGALVFLIGGEPSVVQTARPILQCLGSAQHHVGATPAGAVMKLVVNALFAAQVALCAELLGLVQRSQLDVKCALEVLATLPVLSPAARLALTAMEAQRFDPLFPVALVEKDLRYAMAAASAVHGALPITERAGEVFREAIAAGLGAANLTSVAKLYS